MLVLMRVLLPYSFRFSRALRTRILLLIWPLSRGLIQHLHQYPLQTLLIPSQSQSQSQFQSQLQFRFPLKFQSLLRFRHLWQSQQLWPRHKFKFKFKFK
jgi:hypothetical protein